MSDSVWIGGVSITSTTPCVDSPMKKTADLTITGYLRPDGSNLAALLYLLREKHEDSYRTIARTGGRQRRSSRTSRQLESPRHPEV